MVVPSLYHATEPRFVEVPEVDTPDFGAQRGAGWNHFDRAGSTAPGRGCDTQ
jgi:hypothetical protein